ncbi:FAD-binding oxidoreductase [Varunaivibrio sulfuroxidans]|uniref:4-phosphoerythronate dehydrogenase (FAD-dependent) n=1 Tax=Varunaivibrio sulfuroxidans TaxID=1773489 RepID=A0A4R3J5J9_9PROT|nr:FAD-binding oxidoreductase [Varunaivibrio sulfuroxidans]TCS60113.1 4-phosphoerythronate dehydrogenase (FAD-dependent) [Varunaivibrio sulfuroxidans]WES30913.1 FAD-binding oxidoreductase [Varunaivibrio sulfuroxidans]
MAPTKTAALDTIKAIVGPRGWVAPGDDAAPFVREERGLYTSTPELIVLPATTEEVARVVAICAEEAIAITPQSGNTGLVGGAVAEDGIVLSTRRMDAILDLNAQNATISVQAGCILADIQAAAQRAGLLFPLSLAAEGSCRIGGNLSTNAGGVQVLRYGNARDLVLGLEAVLADGRIWNGMTALRKDNTGYDLKQLFIGAEGTLGIITGAVLKLFPAPKDRVCAMIAMDSPRQALELYVRARERLGDSVTAFEMIPRLAMTFVCRHIPGARDPFIAPYPTYILIELSAAHVGESLQDALQDLLAPALEKGLVGDAVVAVSEAQTQNLWRLRESISEAQKHEGGSIKHDISVAVSHIPEFLDRAGALVKKAIPDARICAFGHIGDGNIHFNISQPEGADKDEFLSRWGEINRLVHDLVVDMGGSFSAEHGIGKLKVGEMERYVSDVALDMMRTLKRTLDPKNIMNPGKIVRP